jgi:hypothetical protein
MNINSENKILVIFTHEHTATDKTGPNIVLQKRLKEKSSIKWNNSKGRAASCS